MKNNCDPVKYALSLRETAAALSISEVSVRRLVKRELLRPSRALVPRT